MDSVINLWFNFTGNKSLDEHSLDELFLFDTIISEHNRAWIMCKAFSSIIENVLKTWEKVTISKNNKDYPNRFHVFEIIDSIFLQNPNEDLNIENHKFAKILKEIEDFLQMSNPYLLGLIKAKWNFKDKIWWLSFLIEKYAFETWEHTEEVWIISKMLAKKINREYGRDIDLSNFKEFWHFHDLGKLLIPADILLKPWKLTPEEFNIIKKHPVYSSILVKIILLYSDDKYDDTTKSYADSIIKIALYHHRTLTGWYPHELSSENITIESEIVRISDIFHALMSQRTYKTEFEPERVWQIIQGMEDTFKFPEVFTVFFSVKKDFTDLLKQRKAPGKLFKTVHNDVIDSEHTLIHNQLEKVLNSHDKQIMEEYNILLRLIKIHFETEEKLMINSDYPDYLSHKKAHDELLTRTSCVVNYKEEDINSEFLKKFVNIWLRKSYYFHSRTKDAKLSFFLSKN